MNPFCVTHVSRAAVLMAALSLGAAAQAQTSTTCKNKVYVDSVYQVGTGGQNYEYYFQLRNGTDKPLNSVTITLAGFDKTVTLFSSHLVVAKQGGPVLGPWMSHDPAIKFGNGSNRNISVGTVRVMYDDPAPAGKASLRVTQCRY